MPFLTKSKIRQSRPTLPTPTQTPMSTTKKSESEQLTTNAFVEAVKPVESSEELKVTETLIQTKKSLEKTLKEREENLRRLKLAKSYKSRV